MQKKLSKHHALVHFAFSIILLNICVSVHAKNENTTAQVTAYIHHAWDRLTRSVTDPEKAIQDPKMAGEVILYLPRDENFSTLRDRIVNHISPLNSKRFLIRQLPPNGQKIEQHGLLYVPYPYVVPGGRFNEMYGWDSYFIELGLLKSNKLTLAKNMVENVIYEIEHYGTILNANRTYYLERSQPPFLTSMILAYYERTQDRTWLKTTLPAIEKLYRYWTMPPHLIPEIGLSRYAALGRGPSPEEPPEYYKKVCTYFRTHDVSDYDKSLYYDAKKDQLTPLFYVADRTVRESGLDVSAKYGPFSASILDYIPVDLNVLLYKHEKDASVIYAILQNMDQSKRWKQRADERVRRINYYLWNDLLGYYFDYNFKTHQSRPYVSATTLYPLWANIASRKQAEKVIKNLPALLAPGGIVMSSYNSNLQWDAPFGWAPFQYFAVKGALNYGYIALAKQIAQRFLHTVNLNFERFHTLFEKYDVQTQSPATENKINFGYTENQMGFGWTNAVYLGLLELQE